MKTHQLGRQFAGRLAVALDELAAHDGDQIALGALQHAQAAASHTGCTSRMKNVRIEVPAVLRVVDRRIQTEADWIGVS